MRFLADENIENEIVESLRIAGHDVLDLKEISPGIGDLEVLALATETRTVIITNDKDFGELVFRDQKLAGGIILLRLGIMSSEEKAERLRESIRIHSAEMISAFTVITPDGIRIRR